MQKDLTLEERVIVALRRITRSVDTHSDFLQRNFGLTGPQLTILRVISRLQPVSAGEVAEAANFNRGTLTGIFDRLEANGFVTRKRNAPDRRTVILKLTAEGHRVLAEAPFLLRRRFLETLAAMPAGEQAALISTLERLAHLMEDDSPIAMPDPHRPPVENLSHPAPSDKPTEA